MNTFSSKLPWLAAMPTATSLPITWAATMVTCSHWVGLTLPGMMEEPGSFSGIVISPRPSRGPLASHRISLAIFIRSAASAFSAPWAKTISSLDVRAWNLFSAVTKGRPVFSAIFAAERESKPSGAFSPVPTAVPPRARDSSGFSASRSSSSSFSRLERQPEISWQNRIGVASCRWVRPHLSTFAFSFSSRISSSFSLTTASMVRSIASAAAMCMAVGKVSLEDWLIFTSSLGCSSFSPAISFPRFAMTSFMFILLWVPEPVCQTTSGKCPSSFPARISSAAWQIAPHFSAVIFTGFSSRLASAAAIFSTAKARMISPGIFSCPAPMGKLFRLRSVWAPQ